jgi:hypothetical protein
MQKKNTDTTTLERIHHRHQHQHVAACEIAYKGVPGLATASEVRVAWRLFDCDGISSAVSDAASLCL